MGTSSGKPTLHRNVSATAVVAEGEWWLFDCGEGAQTQYGNGAVLFTRAGGAARTFARYVKCGMIGVNVAVPAPLAVFPFTGWNQSFFGDLHIQGVEGFHFYTHNKVVLTRWNDPRKRVLGW